MSGLLGSVLVFASLTPANAVEQVPNFDGVVGSDTSSIAPPTDPDIAAATREAVASGEAQVVEAVTTPTELLTALPDGTMQMEISTVPVRSERSEGEWVPVDTNLVLRDGWWEPRDSAAPVRFSSGGSDSLTQVRTDGGEWLTETWQHGPLPAPIIDGRTATYPSVFPDVDLKLAATDIGMTSVYVVKTPEAAANRELSDLAIELQGADIRRESTGEYTAETATGNTITASSPLWWDSSGGGTAEGPGLTASAMGVEHSHDTDSITLDIAATVEGAAPSYPVFIDPDWSVTQNAAWYTDDGWPTQPYLNQDPLRMGRYRNTNGDAFFEFNIRALAGKQILDAQLSTTQTAVMAWPNNPVRLRLFGHQDAGFNRNQQNNNLWGPQMGPSQSPGTWGGPAVTVGWGVTDGVRARVGGEWVQFGLSAEDPNASQSRRHFSRSAKLTVSFNTPPDAPTSPQIDSPQRSCGTASAPAAVSGSDVVVSVNQTDPDGGNVDTNFHLFNGALTSHLQSKYPGLQAAGRRSVTFTGLAEGTYAWYARGSDWMIDGNGTTPWCYFTVDNTAPPAPGVTTSATSFKVGTALNVSLTSSADAAGYQYWLSYAAPTASVPPSPVGVSRTTPLPDCSQRQGSTRFKCATGTTAVTISVAPVDALSTLYVSAYDKSGNVSAARALPLFTSAGTPAARDNKVDSGHAWLTTSMIDPLPTVIPDSNASLGSAAIDLRLPDDGSSWQAVTELKPGYTVPVLHPHEPPEAWMQMGTDNAAVNTSDSFSISMWLKGSFNEYQATQRIASHWASGSDFELKLQDGKLQFCRNGTAATGEAALVRNCVIAPNQIVKDQWIQVTGVWDRVNQQLRLIVGSSASPLAVQPNLKGSNETWAAPGSLMIGPGPTSQRFAGLIANPVVVPGVLDSRQLAALAAFASPFTS